MKRVKRRILLLFILSVSIVNADELSFKILNNVGKEVDAGSSVNLMAQFDNQNLQELSVEVRLKADADGWRLLTDMSSLKIPSKKLVRKVVGVFVPNNQSSGNIPVVLEVVDKLSGSVIAEESFNFFVKPRYGVDVEVIRAPTHLFSGDTSSIALLVRNMSNLDVDIVINQRVGSDARIDKIKLKKEASRIYKYDIKIPKNLLANEQRTYTANIAVQDKDETNKSVFLQFDVFRIGQERVDLYNRYNIQVTGVGALTTAYGTPIYSGMYDVQGRGFLGKPSSKRVLEFKMRGPNRSGNPLFGMNDQYYGQYSSKWFDIALGDNNYGISNLAESSRSGRGVGLLFKIKKLSIGGYYSRPRYYPLISQLMSGYSTYSWNDKNYFQLGFVTKLDTLENRANIVSLTAKNRFFPWLSTNLEYSIGEIESTIHSAYRVGVTFSTKFFGTSIDYTFADTDYPGYFSNTQRLYSSMSFNFDPFTLSLNYNTNRSTQALDTLASNPPITQGAGVNTSVRFLKYFSIYLGAMMSSSKEAVPKPLFDYQRYNGRVGFNANFKRFNLSLHSDGGKLRNYLVDEGAVLTDFFTTNLSTNMTFEKLFTASGNISYQSGQKGITGSETVYYGLGLATSFSDKYILAFSYNSNFEWMYYISDRNLLSLSLNAEINRNNRVALTTNYNLMKNSLDNKTFNAQFRYTHFLRVPISKRKDVGTLEGKLVNAGVEKVSGIRLSIGGRIAISDKDGYFKFKAIPIGSQTLLIDATSFGLHTITERPGPYLVEIIPAKTTYFELSVTKSARIEGIFEIIEDEKVNQKGFIKVVERLDRLVVEASSGEEVYRVLSDVDGGFKFEDLRPGNWNVKVYPNGIPKGYNLVTPQFTITLAPEQTEKIVVKLEKKARQIQFQRTF